MANPRKFSEKIALHNQKQAEETAAFEKIMKEVMDATVVKPVPSPPQPTKPQQQNNLLTINLQSSFRGGSLPNVNQMTQHGDKSPTSRMSHQMFNQQGTSPRSSRNSIGPLRVSKTRAADHAPYASPPNLSMLQSIGMHSGNLGSTGLVYGTNNYLSPPMENAAWRRANSDSALHQTHSLMIPSVVPDSSEESSNNSNDPRDYVLSMGKTHDSPNQLPNTVGDGPNLLEIPTSVSTGSLPDLTSFQFTTPLPQSVDMEEQQLNHSPYSTSPLSVTYSPTSSSPHPPQNSQQQQSPSQPSRQSQQQEHMSQSQISQQQQSMMDNPLQVNVNTSFQNYSNNENMLTAYRCPPRPSPQNSPLSFRSPSPLDGHLSAPPSPTAQPTQNSPESYFVSQQLQQHFEQISMMETTPGRNNGHSWQGGGMANSAQYNFYNPAQQIQTGATAGVTSQQSPQHPQPQTPQTPSSIPDIIFTEFLGADFSEVHSSEPTNLEAILGSDAEIVAQAFRDELEPIDLDGLHMLAHHELVLDPQAEDSFRREYYSNTTISKNFSETNK